MATQIMQFQGQAGVIDCAVDMPSIEIKGWALILHPHPLFDGTRDNKVITTLARLCNQLGLIAVRPNFRGVGQSAGEFDQARGETQDMYLLTQQFRQQFPECAGGRFVLAGFSFGTAVASQLYSLLCEQLASGDTAVVLPDSLVLSGVAAWRFQWREMTLPEHTFVVHGESDDVVPLSEVFDWARPLALPVVVIPGASHFFHGKLVLLKQLVLQYLTRNKETS